MGLGLNIVTVLATCNMPLLFSVIFRFIMKKHGEHAGSPIQVYAPSPLQGEGWDEGCFSLAP